MDSQEQVPSCEEIRSWVVQAGWALRQRLEELIEREEPGAGVGPYRVAQAVHSLVSAQLRLLQPEIVSELGPAGQANHLRRVAGLLVTLYEYLEVAEDATACQVPTSLTAWVEEVARRLSPECHVFLAPTWKYNFYLEPIIKNLKRVLPTEHRRFMASQDVLRGYPEYLSVLQVPQSRAGDYLFYAMCAHELGHLAKEVHGVLGEVGNRVEADAAQLMQWVESLLRDPVPEGIKGRTEGIRGDLASRVDSWLGELVADYLAVALVGPAYLLAFEEFILMCWSPGSLRREADYPPPWLRLGAIVKAIKDFEFYGAMLEKASADGKHPFAAPLQELCRHIDWWEASLSSFLPQKVSDPPDELLLNLVLTLALYHHLGDLEVVCETGWLKNVRYDAAALASHVLSLCEDLERRIPPCQLVKDSGECHPAPFASILNAAALYRFWQERCPMAETRAGKPLEAQKEFDRRKLDHDLVVKAFELSDIHRRFEAFRHNRGVNAIGRADAGSTVVPYA